MATTTTLFHPLSVPIAAGRVRRCPLTLLAPARTAPRRPTPLLVARAKRTNNSTAAPKREADEEVEVEEELPWIQDKALDLVEFTGTVTQAIPGPRVGSSPVPWLLAVPLAYVGVSFALAAVRTFRRFTSPRTQKKRGFTSPRTQKKKRVTKNIFLLKSLDELFQKGREAVDFPALQELMQKTGFDMDDVVRKYIRYTLNEKQFNPDVVVDLIHLRKASMLEDNEVAEILNEISRRIVREKGPIVMDLSGFTEQGFKRKLAVQTLFGKIMYLSELPEFCSRDGSLVVKEIFGVTDEDADSLRSRTLSEAGDIESLERMVDDSDEHGTPSSS
uniref:Armadillo-like repeats domain-containing protein n=1 Tax=Aegilops tauschii TaxID=37682 RepID=M8CG75_AEGTA